MTPITAPVPVVLNERQPIEVSFSTVTLGSAGKSPTYNGPHKVTPDFSGTTLETANRCMAENVTVEPIGISKTINPSGGYTVIIGGK